MAFDLTGVKIFQEPELEFGNSGRHVDLRTGLALFGPLIDTSLEHERRSIKVGVVGTGQTVADSIAWMSQMARNGAPAKTSRLTNLFVEFPGTDLDRGLRHEFVFDGSMGEMLQSSLALASNAGFDEVQAAIDEIVAISKQVADRRRPDVLVVALPQQFLDSIPDDVHARFRGLLKATMIAKGQSLPIQNILPSTYDKTKIKAQKKRPHLQKALQDEATRAWNLFTGLYYKAGGTPWRLPKKPTDYTSCVVGICFFRTDDAVSLHSSMAQVFDERGVGAVVRGAEAHVDKGDRRPYLTAEDAYKLLSDALRTYARMHRTMPARVTVHKTSEFRDSEIDGLKQAAKENRVEMLECVWIGGTDIRLFRNGAYPPLRGTAWELGDNRHLLYTRGSVQAWKTYPGMYIPNPVLVRLQQVERSADEVLQEILALTKMNWNNTQFDNRLPITLTAARAVGDVLKHIPKAASIAHEYRYYM